MGKSHKISLFATVTDGCEEAYFMGISQYIYENELTCENMYLPMILGKNSQFHFSFFKVDPQNPKFSLEYLLLNVTTVTTGHQKLPKIGRNSIKSLGQRPKPSAGARSMPA